MLNIGIDRDQGVVYEGKGHYGRAVWPFPFITPARILFASEEPLIAEKSSDSITTACRFREDFFDPISRIRRGRFYFAQGTQPSEWLVQRHPALPVEGATTESRDLRKLLESFYGESVWHKFLEKKPEQPLVLLGRDERFTIWTIINIEVISTGDELVTLKARSGLGILPVIEADMIPQAFRSRVSQSLNAFADEVYRAAPISVIDRARDAASQVLLAHFEATGKKAEELGALANRLEQEKKVIAASAAKIIARLHARAKPVERERREMRAIREEDAQLATQCVGTLLCELGWADWP